MDQKHLHGELQVFSKIGSVLHIDPADSLAAASLKRQDFEKTLETASKGLLEVARRRGNQVYSEQSPTLLSEPFFHLTPEERFLLVSLHIGRWSYSRLGRILNLSIEQIEELAWVSRLELCGSQGYPSAPISPGTECPSYDMKRPWTQRYLDEEIQSKRELLFLQNHLAHCQSCVGSLKRTRELYYRVSGVVHKLTSLPTQESSLAEVLENSPLSSFSFKKSLKAYWNRPNTKLLVCSFLALIIFKLMHWIN